MKLNRVVIEDLVSKVRQAVEPVELNKGKLLKAFYMDDLTLSFLPDDEDFVFYGLGFEALGRDFFVLNDYSVLVLTENDEGDSETHEVVDKEFIGYLNEYLHWRTKVVAKFHS